MGNLNFAKDHVAKVVERKEFKDVFRLTKDVMDSVTPPPHLPNLYPSRTIHIRKYEGGTVEDALPVLKADQEAGCVTHWNGKQWLKADVWLMEELAARAAAEAKRREAKEENDDLEGILEEVLRNGERSLTRTRT